MENPKFVCQVSIFTTKREADEIAQRMNTDDAVLVSRRMISGTKYSVCRDMPRNNIPYGHLLKIEDGMKIVRIK